MRHIYDNVEPWLIAKGELQSKGVTGGSLRLESLSVTFGELCKCGCMNLVLPEIHGNSVGS